MANIVDGGRAWIAAACLVIGPGLVAIGVTSDARAAGAVAQCGPSLLGAPCAQDGVATQAEAGAATNLGIGNPVNLATGNKYQRAIDLPALPGLLGVELVRHYNARDLRADALGRNWVWSYDTRLFRVGDSVQIVQADGSRVDFARGGPGAVTCLPMDPALGLLHVRAGVRGETMAWQWRDGRVLSFDEDGFLVGISVASGESLAIRRARDAGRHRGVLLEVTDPRGRRLVFDYGAAAADGWRPLLHIDSPAGRFTYAQDEERRLSTVTSPSGNARDYLYEVGTAAWMTGIVARPVGGAPQRLRSWGYDARGRVVSAVRGPPDVQAGSVQIEYGEGQTRVRNATGGVTRLTHRQAGARTVLMAVEGAGCEDCAVDDASRRYDALGRLTQAAGVGVERDMLGRVTLLREAGATTRVAWLADSTLPTQVDAPSSVAGQRHVRRIDWLQFSDPATGVWRAVPKRIAETGWRPGPAGPQAIDRAWVLGWQMARGVATLVGVKEDRDAAVTSSRASTPVPAKLRPASSAERASLPAIDGWPDLGWRRDDFGLPVLAEGAGGRPVAGAEARDYDPAGRLVSRVFADGTRWTYAYDTSGRLLMHRARRGDEATETTLSWQDGLPVRIAHAAEAELRSYGPDQRMRRREVTRAASLNGNDGGAPVHYAETFGWDTRGRMQRHDLPEGGSVFYDWSGEGLAAIRYLPSDGPEMQVFSQTAGGGGILRRWFNGVVGLSRPDGTLHYLGRGRLLLGLARRTDRQGRVLVEALRRPAPPPPISSVPRTDLPGPRDSRWGTPDLPDPRRLRSLLSAANLPATALGAVALLVDRLPAALSAASSVRSPPAVPAAAASADVFEANRYGYDGAGRLISAAHAGGQGNVPALWPKRRADYFAWGPGGEVMAQASHGLTTRPTRVREPGGLPRRADGLDLRYGPSRRLIAVDRAGVAVARYAHNAFGERIVRQVGDGAPTHDFYLGQQLVAEQGSGPTGTIARRYLYAGPELVAILDYAGGRPLLDPSTSEVVAKWSPSNWLSAWFKGASSAAEVRVLAVHPDATGTPRLVTDADQRERWRGDFSPFGALRSEAGDIAMRLRLPGQVSDAETGWHDNYLRTYDPQAGSYLEPDPLGAEPGTEAYGYAAQQPARFIDPLGLLLFAFDGTNNSPASRTNIFLMKSWYQDQDASAAGIAPQYYVWGPGSQEGTILPALDVAASYTAKARLDEQWKNLLGALAKYSGTADKPVQIDIIGFSRGSALARQFANMIIDHVENGRFSARTVPVIGALVTACMNLRFLGVFDTVPQMFVGVTDIASDFTIGPGWDQVAHATALHETRQLFPLTTTEAGANGLGAPASPVIEIGLIGAHSDLGGGYFYEDDGLRMGDLSNVSLNWMMLQALETGVQFGNLPKTYRYVNDPSVHAESDYRLPLLSQVLNPTDRWVNSATSAQMYSRQALHPLLGKVLRDQVSAFITPVKRWEGPSGPVVGRVDMEAYRAWLDQTLGLRMLPSPEVVPR